MLLSLERVVDLYVNNFLLVHHLCHLSISSLSITIFNIIYYFTLYLFPLFPAVAGLCEEV